MAESEKKRGFSFMRLFGVLFGVLLVLAIGAAGLAAGGWWWANKQFEAAGPSAEETVVLLPRGAGLIQIANQLEAEGVISDARIFRGMVTIDGGDRDLRAGEYAIPPQASMADIYALLQSGETVRYPVTFAEGLTSAMIVRIIEANEVLTGDIAAIPPEGTLLPETYFVDRGTTRQELLDRMHADQQALLDRLWESRAENLPFDTREEAIILASVVEKETGVASERPHVASVYVNRLNRGMRLESDPTIIYGITAGEPLGRGIRRSELDNTANLYNTYHHDGLPPTAIANPGRESLAAVLNPADTNDLFFVADGTGGHVFAATYREHARNVANWRPDRTPARWPLMGSALSGMTGFARIEGGHDAWSWVWEARSVNGRGLEPRFRLPPGHDGLEPALREAVKRAFSRGNIQFSLNLNRDADAAPVQIDTERLNAILDAGEPFIAAGRVAKPTLDGLLAIRGVLKSDEDEISDTDREALNAALGASFTEVVKALQAARREEGRALDGMLSDIITEIETLTADAARCAAGRPEAVRDRLQARLDDLVGGEFSEDRLLQEIALLASKADVREEIDRLGAHISGARDLLAGGSPVGRKLDFLSQEFNRETNTLCSKSGDSDLTRIGLAMKAAVEQFREQVQNVE